jgi:hypothetical protein
MLARLLRWTTASIAVGDVETRPDIAQRAKEAVYLVIIAPKRKAE